MKTIKRITAAMAALALAGVVAGCAQRPAATLSDEALLDSVERRTFDYFWSGAEPNSGLACERINMDGIYPENDETVVTTGGSGFGILALIAGMERGYVTREQGIEAARAAQCHDFIESLPDGYHTRIGDKGVYLSGGESQRVCVARAILKNAPILVLDEATAYADPENERQMQLALRELIKNKTVIIIAHRLSSIISAEQILVLKEGKLVQSGRHEVLSKTDGVYKRMWDAYTSAFRWQLTIKKEETK